ncbi:MAG TPA: acyltransferase domain-containing protein, partial [Polyangiaceae bacterium]|nr:acyltransferase domain-containing protein [Polyangiaceae bacterium]
LEALAGALWCDGFDVDWAAAAGRPGARPPAGPVCVLVSGKGEGARARNAARLAERLRGAGPGELVDVAYSLATARAHFEDRGSVLARTAAEAVEGLEALSAGREHAGLVSARAAARGKLAFVFPGQGAQWPGMGRALLEECAAFREAAEACEAALRPATGWSVLALLRGEQGGGLPALERVDAVQPALFVMYVGLAAAWRALGLEPDAVVGHSQGEVAAAVVAGALTLEQGARVVALRSRAVRERGLGGAMAVVERPVEEVEALLAPYGGALSLAVVNTGRSAVVAGDADAVDRLVAEVQARGAFCRKVAVDYASHSAHMDALLPGLRAELAGLRPAAARVPFYSTVTGGPLEGEALGAEYWCRNLREPVRLDRALERLLADGHGAFVEVSPHPVLALALTEVVSRSGGVAVGSLRRERGGLAPLLGALGELHAHGHPVDWERAFAGRGARRVDLPTYAFERRRYWLAPPKARADARSMGLEPAEHPWLGAATELADGAGHLLAGRLSLGEHPWLRDHAVMGRVLVPGTGLVDLALRAAREAGVNTVAELALEAPLVLEADPVRLQLTVGPADGKGRRPFTLYGRPEGAPAATPWRRHAGGDLIEAPRGADDGGFADLRAWPPAGAEAVPREGLYERLRAQGFEYGPAFQGLVELWRRGGLLFGRVRLPERAGADAAAYALHPALFDAALHVVVGADELRGERGAGGT